MTKALKAKLSGIFKSWTIWFNTFVASLIPMLDYAQSQLPFIREYLPGKLYVYAFVAAVVGNIVLRFKTNAGLEDKNDSGPAV